MSQLEETLAFQIRVARLPKPEREVSPIEGRKFRFDFGWKDRRVLVEVQGGIWVKSGHSSGTGIERDMEKGNLAQLDGWVVLHVGKKHIESGEALDWIKRALHAKA